MEKLCSKTHVRGHSATPEHAALALSLSLSLSIDAACPGVSLRTNQPRPTGVTGSSRINSKWCHLSSRFMCPHVHPCVPTFIHASPRTNPVVCFKNKRATQCKTMQDNARQCKTMQDNARRFRGWGTMLHTILKIQLWRSFAAKPMCKVTMRHQNMPRSLSLSLSLNRCSLSWGFSDDEAATSYGRNKIKSY